jgi:hypothetical protein
MEMPMESFLPVLAERSPEYVVRRCTHSDRHQRQIDFWKVVVSGHHVQQRRIQMIRSSPRTTEWLKRTQKPRETQAI